MIVTKTGLFCFASFRKHCCFLLEKSLYVCRFVNPSFLSSFLRRWMSFVRILRQKESIKNIQRKYHFDFENPSFIIKSSSKYEA